MALGDTCCAEDRAPTSLDFSGTLNANIKKSTPYSREDIPVKRNLNFLYNNLISHNHFVTNSSFRSPYKGLDLYQRTRTFDNWTLWSERAMNSRHNWSDAIDLVDSDAVARDQIPRTSPNYRDVWENARPAANAVFGQVIVETDRRWMNPYLLDILRDAGYNNVASVRIWWEGANDHWIGNAYKIAWSKSRANSNNGEGWREFRYQGYDVNDDPIFGEPVYYQLDDDDFEDVARNLHVQGRKYSDSIDKKRGFDR